MKKIRICALLLAVLCAFSALPAFAASKLLQAEVRGKTVNLTVNREGRENVALIVKKPGQEKYRYLTKDLQSDYYVFEAEEPGEYSFRAVMTTNGKKGSTKEVIVVIEDGSCLARMENSVLPVPQVIRSAEEAMNAINRTVLLLGEPMELPALGIGEYFEDIGNAAELHNGFLQEGKMTYGAQTYNGDGWFTFDFAYDEAGQLVREYLYGDKADDTARVEFLRKYVKETLEAVIDEEMTDGEKAEALHDHIVANFAYDTALCDDGDYSKESFTAYGLVKNGYAVCEGYAELYALLCIWADVPCYCVTGVVDGMNHMWNKVYVDGGWLNVDCTMDDPLPDRGSKVRQERLLKTDVEYVEYGYEWQSGLWPAAE